MSFSKQLMCKSRKANNHRFSAFWLRLSVEKQIINLILSIMQSKVLPCPVYNISFILNGEYASDMWRTGMNELSNIYFL